MESVYHRVEEIASIIIISDPISKGRFSKFWNSDFTINLNGSKYVRSDFKKLKWDHWSNLTDEMLDLDQNGERG